MRIVAAGGVEQAGLARAARRRTAEQGVDRLLLRFASGQAGGTIPLQGGIVLALNRMNSILAVDALGLQVLAEPGVIHARLNARLAAQRLVFPPDPGSSKMCTVGGMAATNAHGMRAVKYGPTSDWVLGLRVVLPGGRAITTGGLESRARQSSSGLQLTKLFVGSEGTLGVVTRLSRQGHTTAVRVLVVAMVSPAATVHESRTFVVTHQLPDLSGHWVTFLVAGGWGLGAGG